MSVVHCCGTVDDQRGDVAVACGQAHWVRCTTEHHDVTCKRCLALLERAEQPKRLIVTRADARKELLSQAAAFLNHWECTTYEGSRVREGDDETGDAWAMLNAERQRLAKRLHKESGMPGGISAWDPDL